MITYPHVTIKDDKGGHPSPHDKKYGFLMFFFP